jgi:hypothetical protein
MQLANHRTFNEMISHITPKSIRETCSNQDYICHQSCIQYPHVFCRIKCDSLISIPAENLLNFKCFKECLGAFKDLHKAPVNNNNISPNNNVNTLLPMR